MIPNDLPKGTKIRCIDAKSNPCLDGCEGKIYTVHSYKDYENLVLLEEYIAAGGFKISRFEIADTIQSTDLLLLI